MAALEAGAEDFVIQEEEYEISTSPEDFSNVLETLENLNIPTKIAQVTMVPQTTVTLGSDAEIKMIKLLEALEDHDDVQDVYSNFEMTEE